MREIHEGVCSICGKYDELTFEHIPPKQAFNWQRAKIYTGDEVLKRIEGEPAKYCNLQQGMGKYSLCQSCNNNTGAWYAQTYCDFAMDVIKSLDKNEHLNHGDVVEFTFRRCCVLQIVKQVIAMFCSILPYDEVQRLGFDKLLLEKESNTVNRGLFDLRMYLTSPENGQLMCGPAAVLIKKDEYPETIWVADLGVYPFGYILNLTPEIPVKYGGSIMDMFSVKYDEKCDFKLSLMYLERKSIDFPLPLMFKELPDK